MMFTNCKQQTLDYRTATDHFGHKNIFIRKNIITEKNIRNQISQLLNNNGI